MRTDLRRVLLWLIAAFFFVSVVVSCAAYDLGHITITGR